LWPVISDKTRVAAVVRAVYAQSPASVHSARTYENFLQIKRFFDDDLTTLRHHCTGSESCEVGPDVFEPILCDWFVDRRQYFVHKSFDGRKPALESLLSADRLEWPWPTYVIALAIGHDKSVALVGQSLAHIQRFPYLEQREDSL
jgi:hypothetical protein